MLVKLGQRGQITIPKTFREKFDLEPGDKISISETEEGILLTPVTMTIFDLRGSIPVQPDGPYSLETIREKVGEYIANRHRIKKNG